MTETITEPMTELIKNARASVKVPLMEETSLHSADHIQRAVGGLRAIIVIKFNRNHFEDVASDSWEPAPAEEPAETSAGNRG